MRQGYIRTSQNGSLVIRTTDSNITTAVILKTQWDIIRNKQLINTQVEFELVCLNRQPKSIHICSYCCPPKQAKIIFKEKKNENISDFIDALLCQNFQGFKEEEINAYKTACITIQKRYNDTV